MREGDDRVAWIGILADEIGRTVDKARGLLRHRDACKRGLSGARLGPAERWLDPVRPAVGELMPPEARQGDRQDEGNDGRRLYLTADRARDFVLRLRQDDGQGWEDHGLERWPGQRRRVGAGETHPRHQRAVQRIGIARVVPEPEGPVQAKDKSAAEAKVDERDERRFERLGRMSRSETPHENRGNEQQHDACARPGVDKTFRSPVRPGDRPKSADGCQERNNDRVPEDLVVG